MFLRLTAVAMALAAGFGLAQGASASEATNGLGANGLGANGLSANGLSANGLSANGRVINGLATNGTYSDCADLTAVILPDGSRITLE
jgi:hypothetical protein